MSCETQILRLLSDKRDLFLEMEEVTSAMCLQQVEQIAESMDRRSRLIERIDLVDASLADLCAGRDWVRAAMQHTCDRDGLPQELGEVYDASMAVKAVVNRIVRNDDAVKAHLEFEKQRVLQKVEELNRSGTAVANQYYQSVKTAIPNPVGGLHDEKI